MLSRRRPNAAPQLEYIRDIPFTQAENIALNCRIYEMQAGKPGQQADRASIEYQSSGASPARNQGR
jgi:hypothetical protein